MRGRRVQDVMCMYNSVYCVCTSVYVLYWRVCERAAGAAQAKAKAKSKSSIDHDKCLLEDEGEGRGRSKV